MRTAIPILIFAAAVWAGHSSQAAAPAGSKERLRRLVHLPRLSFAIGLGFDPLRGFALTPDRPTTLDEIGKLRKNLVGSPADARRFTRLGRLWESIGGHNEARQAFSKAVELYRLQGAEQGNDGILLADYGTALQGLGDLDAAERMLRASVEAAPESWVTHAALGRLLTAQALGSLSVQPGATPSSLLAAMRSTDGSVPKLAPGQAEKAQARIEESLRCYDRAVALGPSEPEPYTNRAAARACRNLVQWIRDPAPGTEPEFLRLARGMYPPEALPDLREAMRLAPRDPQAIGAALLFELLSNAIERGGAQLGLLGTGEGWESLPEPVRQSVRESLARLEELSQTAEAPVAAAALEMLGSLQCLVINDLPGAERTLRRATALDPRRTQAWETLVYILASTKRAEALLAVCEDRLKADDTPRARLMVAKAYELLGDWDRVLEACDRLHRRYPEDLYANLAMAAALVRCIADEIVLGRSLQLLAKAEKLAGTSPSREQVVNLLFLRGLVLAVAGQIESARDHLKQVKELDEEHDGLQEALEILESM